MLVSANEKRITPELTKMPQTLAVARANPRSEEIEKAGVDSGVRQVLDTFVARDPQHEIITAVRHFPAREAQWADFPMWIREDLKAAYSPKGIHRLYTHQAA